MEKIRWGIIGCGDVTEKKSGPGFSNADGSALTAVMRRNAAKAEDYARRHSVPRWYSDADDLINDDAVDAVYVATPPAFHLEYTIKAAQAGKPVYVEKPMALNADECRQMIAACRRSQVPLFVAYYRRALPRFLKIKSLIESGSIGEVRSVQVTLRTFRHTPLEQGPPPWRLDPSLSGGGYFVDMGTHTLDLLDFLLGPIESVCGFAENLSSRYQVEDTVSAAFQFKSGIIGEGLWSFTVPDECDETLISGTEGSIVFSCFHDEAIVLSTERGVSRFDIDNPPHVQQPLIQSVVDALLGRGSCPSTGDSALRTTRITDMILGGYYHR